MQLYRHSVLLLCILLISCARQPVKHQQPQKPEHSVSVITPQEKDTIPAATTQVTTPHQHHSLQASPDKVQDTESLPAEKRNNEKLHTMMSDQEIKDHVKKIEAMQNGSERSFIFKLSAPMSTTVRGFTPMAMIGFVDKEGNSVATYGRFLQLSYDSSLTVKVYKPGPFYINYISSNLTGLMNRSIDFTQDPDKSALRRIAGKTMPGLGPIYLKTGEETADYTIHIDVPTQAATTPDRVYHYENISISYEGSLTY